MPSSPIVARLSVRPPPAAAARREPITIGVPLGEGRVRDVARLVATSDRTWPTDARVLETWPDGSARWALLDIDLDVPAAGLTLDVRDDLAAAPAGRLTIARHGDDVTVDDGTLSATISAGDPRVIVRLERGGTPAAVVHAPLVRLHDEHGAAVDVRFTSVAIEHAGTRRAVVCVAGTAMFGEADLDVRVRLTFLAGWSTIGVDLALHNPRAAVHAGGFWDLGDPGSIRLRDAGIGIATPSAPAGLRVSVAPERAAVPGTAPLVVRQVGSGGPQWQSRVHLNRDGVVAVDGPGAVTSGVADAAADRVQPWIACDHATGTLVVTARRFWELFPKAIEVDDDGGLRCWSLPPGHDLHELQGGERCDFSWWITCGDRGAGELAWCRQPSTALPDVAEVARVEHLPAVEPVSPDVNAGYEALVGAALDGDDTFLAKRERIDEYGWRHFGDLYADHENGDEPGRLFVSHYNNQYDAVLGLTLQALRRDDHRWWQQADDLARHVARIDVYWTSRDRAAYNGGLFWHTGHYTDAHTSTHRCYPKQSALSGGGPSNEHCYSTGLLWHYFLTGDPTSRAAVVSLGEWMIAIDDGTRARWPLPWLSQAPTGGASATVSPDYHGPGRGPANAVLSLLNAYRLTGDARFADKALALVRRVIHPDDDPAAHRLLEVELRWSYTVMLQALGKCLFAHVGDEATQAYMRASLLRYARWMADHEYFYLDDVSVLEFPTETWAAQDIRKSEVFDLAAWHAPSADERDRFLERARYFHARAIESLAASPTRTRTRPLVLLLQYGFARTWFERETPRAPLGPAPRTTWPPRAVFEPQRGIARRRLIWIAAAGAATAAAAGVALLGMLLR